MKLKILGFVFSIFTLSVLGQESDLEVYTDSLDQWSQTFSTAKYEKKRRVALEKFNEGVLNWLQSNPSQDLLKKIKPLSNLRSKDGKLSVYTWGFARAGGIFEFYGYIHYNDDWIQLIDSSGENIPEVEYQWLGSKRWYGAFYYDLVQTKKEEKKIYNLIGFRPRLTGFQEKVIEPIEEVDQNSDFRFGSKVFETPEIEDNKFIKKPNRLVFRYSPSHNASIKYLEAEDLILIDHLTAPDASLKKQWDKYGPDFSYDALTWEDESWVLKTRVVFDSPIKTKPRQENFDSGLAPKRKPENSKGEK